MGIAVLDDFDEAILSEPVTSVNAQNSLAAITFPFGNRRA
jgi:hypothetical protein